MNGVGKNCRIRKISHVKVFDRDQLVRSMGPDLNILKDVIRDYLDYHYATARQLHVEIENRNTAAIAHTAHRLKASAATVGAMQVSVACEAIEHYSEQENFVKVFANQQLLTSAYRSFRANALQFIYEDE